jgi:hypothetical protein
VRLADFLYLQFGFIDHDTSKPTSANGQSRLFMRIRMRVAGETHRQVLEGTRILDVSERRLEVLQLDVDLRFRLLRLGNLTFGGSGSAARTSFFFPERVEVRNWVQENGSGTHGFGFERLDGLDVRADVVRDGLKVAQDLLRFVDDGFVLQNGAVVR